MSKLLFITRSTFYPESSGGAQKSSLFLFEELRKLGWEIQVVCSTSVRSRYFIYSCLKLQPTRIVLDKDLGYPIWRWVGKFGNDQDWMMWLDNLLESYQPDVVLGQNSPGCFLLNHALSKGHLCCYFIRSLTCFELGEKPPKDIKLIANSPLAAAASSSYTDEHIPVVLPFVDLNRYIVERGSESILR